MKWMIGCFLLLIGVVSYACYWAGFYYPQKRHGERLEHSRNRQNERYWQRMNELYAQLEQVPCQIISVYSYDGFRLMGRYYEMCAGAPLIIMFHGYRGDGVRDMCGGYVVGRALGYNMLIVDQRAHGFSDGNTISMGIRERWDCVAWTQYAADRFGLECKIFLYGISMGASTVLMASGLNLPSQVAGVIADSPYSSPKEIIYKVCVDMRVWPKLAYPFIALGALLYGGFRIGHFDCISPASESKIPILLIHGDEDRFVPWKMSEAISASGDHIQMVKIPDAGHVLSFYTDEERYLQVFREFVKQCL